MVKTPSDKWKKNILKYKKQCQTILEVSNNIRYAGVINNYGRTLTGVIKPNLKPLLNSEDVKHEFFITLTVKKTSPEKIRAGFIINLKG